MLFLQVTHLVFTRPRHFKYKAGDYIFIQIPKIAPHEWHPFTISSAPEQRGALIKGLYTIGEMFVSVSIQELNIYSPCSADLISAEVNKMLAHFKR